MRKRARLSLSMLLIVATGCASLPPSRPSPLPEPLDAYAMNITALDLTDPITAACRLNVYLTEIEQAGHQKHIRIVYPPDWGPYILQHWFPVIRSHGFRVTIILAQERTPVTNVAAWLTVGIPPIRDLIDGAELMNEPSSTSQMGPHEYALWHRALDRKSTRLNSSHT